MLASDREPLALLSISSGVSTVASPHVTHPKLGVLLRICVRLEKRRDLVLLHLRHKGRLDNLAEALDHRSEHLSVLVAHLAALGLDERHALLDGRLSATELLREHLRQPLLGSHCVGQPRNCRRSRWPSHRP